MKFLDSSPISISLSGDVCDQTEPDVTMCDILSADLESPRHAVTHHHQRRGYDTTHNSPKPLEINLEISL